MSIFQNLQGRRIPGGCVDCTAYQTVREDAPNVYVVVVHHDDTCPTLRRIERSAE